MTRDKKILRASILIAYVFIGLYILFYSAKIYKLRDFSGMYFLFSLSIVNNISLLIFLLSDDRKIFVDHSSLIVLFSLWILFDYIFLYKYKINFKYTHEISLSFIYLLIFYNLYIFLNNIKEIKWKYFNYLALIILLMSFISNYFNNFMYIKLLKIFRILIGFFPILLVFIYRRQIKEYSNKLMLSMIFISFIYMIYFVSTYFVEIFSFIYISEIIFICCRAFNFDFDYFNGKWFEEDSFESLYKSQKLYIYFNFYKFSWKTYEKL